MYDLRGLDITVVLTSCGRLHELSQTLESFHNSYIPARFIVIDDKADAEIAAMLAQNYPHIEVVLNSPQLGQFASIDKAYGLVNTRYIFHMEDDRSCAQPHNIQASIALLEQDIRVVCVCLNNLVDVPKKNQKWDVVTIQNQNFYIMKKEAHPEWFGYSFNPSIVKHETWQKLNSFAAFKSEENISLYMKKRNQGVAYLAGGTFQHIGYSSHVDDPFQPKRGKRFWPRLKRSIEKRINRIKRRFEK